MNNTQQKHIIVVLGMHRSGTSVITRSLKVLGVELGERLIAGIPENNEKGFYEDAEINAFDNELLQELGHDWHTLTPVLPNELATPAVGEFKLRAVEILRNKLSTTNCFGLKDPRIPRLLPFWQDVFAHLQVRVSYVIACRNPMSVARSLAKRDGFDLEKGYYLWLEHMLQSLAQTANQSRLVVDYDRLMEDPADQLQRIAQNLGLTFDPESPEFAEYHTQFLEDSLRHTRYRMEDLYLDKSIPPIVIELYKTLVELATDAVQFEHREVVSLLRRVNEQFHENYPALRYMQACEERSALLAHQAIDLDAKIAALTQTVSERENELVQLRVTVEAQGHALAECDGQIADLSQAVSARDERLIELERTVTELEDGIAALLQAMSDDEEEIHNLMRTMRDLAGKEGPYVSLVQAVIERNHQICKLRGSIQEREAHIALLSQSLSALQGQLETLALEVSKRDREIAELHVAVASRDEQTVGLTQTLVRRDEQIMALTQAAVERERQIAELKQQLLAINDQVNTILASNSWRLTKPFRAIRRNLVDRSYWFVRRVISDSARWIWQHLPLSIQRKQKLKTTLFRRLPFVFGWTQAYRSWKSFGADEVIESCLPGQDALRGDEAVRNEFVPLFKGQPLVDKPVKLICFYLPQFHATPENDAWWGEGFTEWTNVRPAEPQFVGHYQPHIPGELGYYNLLDPAVMRRQVELAKLYGIGGFCFYFYWFGGKRLLETPIEKYLSDEGLDLPFCLCWANENWTRRWDGLDSEILIAQEHSPEDDIAFIRHVARYMRDPRYIRIDGKPLLLVYRPSLLPSAIDTAQRWRTWCRNEGIGEIYLAYTQSFESADPSEYGFDAAVEFPPNNSSVPNITERVIPMSDDFACNVYDWEAFVERSRVYKKPAYKLFRGVCPSWDNTARRKNHGTILLNSNPRGYQEWLYNAISDTCKRFSNLDERLIFINAWNEWAEGAHLEPDRRYGYAYLEASRMALVRYALFDNRARDMRRPIAIIIHAFYADIFDEILCYLRKITEIPFKVYVTCHHEISEYCRACLMAGNYDFSLLTVTNRGRDVLPFLKIMPEVAKGGHEILVKVHTKRSPHRQDGDVWRRDLLDKLLTESALSDAIRHFQQFPDTGILGPAGHVVPMSCYWGSNALNTLYIAERLGVDERLLQEFNFVAGTMFFARITAMLPLMNLAIDEEAFEQEDGQTDGTMAHAFERIMPVSAWAAGLSTRAQLGIDADSYEYSFARRTGT